jgi:hypothetical protein
MLLDDMIVTFVPKQKMLSNVSKNTLELALRADRLIVATDAPTPQLIVKLDQAEYGALSTTTLSNVRLPDI